MAEPVSTIGDSAPTEPPSPIVMALASTEDHILCGLIRLFRCEKAINTFDTPWLISCLSKFRTNSAVISTPKGGSAR